MVRTAFPARRIRLVIPALVVACWLYWLSFTLRGWPIRLFVIGFMATIGTTVFMASARRRGDRNALAPCVIGIVGVLAVFILLSRTPQPLTVAGCVGLAVGAIAWAVRLLSFLAIRRRAAAAPTVRSAKDQEGA